MTIDRRRVVFVLLPNGPRVAAIRDTHLDWFRRLGLDAEATLRDCTRGYLDDRGVHLYRGADFLADDGDVARVVAALERLRKRVPWLRDDMSVYAGPDPRRYLGAVRSGDTGRERLVCTVGQALRGEYTPEQESTK